MTITTKSNASILYIGTCLLFWVMVGLHVASAQGNEFTVPLSDPAKRGKLKAQINSGSITVKGTARKDVLVRYTTQEEKDSKGKDKPDASRDGLRRVGGSTLNLEVAESNNQVKIRSASWSNKINLEIEVPAGMDVEVQTYNDGDLMITNIQGLAELTNFNGDITALNISGAVVATTYNGEIKVTFDKLAEGTPMSYATYNGDVDISFPGNIKATFKVKTDQGEIYSGFDADFKSSGPVQKKDAQSGVYKVVIDEWKRADVNGGGPEITLRNYNGNIYIRKK